MWDILSVFRMMAKEESVRTEQEKITEFGLGGSTV